MRIATRLLFAFSLSTLSAAALPAEFPGETWKAASPVEGFGWSSEKLEIARRFAEQLGSDAVMVVDDGRAVAQWGDTAKRQSIYSMRKSLLSALVGMAADEAKINLDATLADLAIDDNLPALNAAERQARVRDLLTSRSGVYHIAAYETPSAVLARPRRGSHSPGQFFYYNNWDFNALGTIYEQQTQTDIFSAFQSKIAAPLEMQDFRKEDGRYHRHKSSRHPAYLFDMSARDLARFGLLYLREGNWSGQEIISRRWIEESTKVHVKDARPRQGYGYLWWVSPENGAFEASGKGGQRLWISPRETLVVVHLVDVATPEKRDVSGEQFFELLGLIRAARLPRHDGR